MNIFTSRDMKQCAQSTLLQAKADYRKTVLFHEIVMLGALLLVQLLSLLVNTLAGDTGGLSGIGTRSLVGTVQAVASLATTVLMPFWSIGLLHTTIQLVRREAVERPMLAEGFRRFGLVLRYNLMMILIAFLVIMAGTNLAVMLSAFVPVPEEMYAAMDTVGLQDIQDPYRLMALIPWDALLAVMIPFAVICFVIFGAAFLYLNYRLYAAPYLVMDEDCPGALAALSASNRLTKGYKWKLLKLDLSFWWYYLLQFAAGILVYGNVILLACGIQLPMDAAVADLLFYLLYIAASLGITWFAGAYVHTTHACAYQQMLDPRVLLEE